MTLRATTTGSNPFDQPAYVKRCQAISKVLLSALESHFPWDSIKTVVDLGCGSGAVGSRFVELGKSVLFVEGRGEHVVALQSKGVHALLHDAQVLLQAKSDLVLCLGLLYHSEDPQKILDNCAAIAPVIVVETLCMDETDRYFVSFEEDTGRSDQSLDGGCCRFSPSWLERALRRAGYERIIDLSKEMEAIPGDGFHLGFMYNWELRDSGNSYRDGYGLRKLWVAWK